MKCPTCDETFLRAKKDDISDWKENFHKCPKCHVCFNCFSGSDDQYGVPRKWEVWDGKKSTNAFWWVRNLESLEECLRAIKMRSFQ